MEFQLRSDFIELDNLLKVLKIAEDGVLARDKVLAGEVRVNGEVELRVRRKLRPGDCVETGGSLIKIVA
jgi:ribosome-associated protein